MVAAAWSNAITSYLRFLWSNKSYHPCDLYANKTVNTGFEVFRNKECITLHAELWNHPKLSQQIISNAFIFAFIEFEAIPRSNSDHSVMDALYERISSQQRFGHKNTCIRITHIPYTEITYTHSHTERHSHWRNEVSRSLYSRFPRERN